MLAGEFQIVNPWLLRDLVSLGIWDDQMKNRIIAAGGSVQNVPGIPDELRALYKTVWELSQKCVIDLAADRGAFICQSQSLNIHLSAPTMAQLTSMHFYGASRRFWNRHLTLRRLAQRVCHLSSSCALTSAVSRRASTTCALARLSRPFRCVLHFDKP